MEEEYKWKFKLDEIPEEGGDPRTAFFRTEIDQLLDIVELIHEGNVVCVDSFRFIGDEEVHPLFVKGTSASPEESRCKEKST